MWWVHRGVSVSAAGSLVIPLTPVEQTVSALGPAAVVGRRRLRQAGGSACCRHAVPTASSGRGFEPRVWFLPSLPGSVQRPHSDGEKRDEAEQPPADPDPNAAAPALRSECLPAPNAGAAPGVGAGARGQPARWPTAVRPELVPSGPGPSLESRGRDSAGPRRSPAPISWGGGQRALLPEGLILTSPFSSPRFSSSDRFHADGIPAQPLPYAQAPVPHRASSRSHGHAQRRPAGALLSPPEPRHLPACPALPAAARFPGKKQPGCGIAPWHAQPPRASCRLHPSSARPGRGERRARVPQAAAG